MYHAVAGICPCARHCGVLFASDGMYIHAELGCPVPKHISMALGLVGATAIVMYSTAGESRTCVRLRYYRPSNIGFATGPENPFATKSCDQPPLRQIYSMTAVLYTQARDKGL